MNELIKIEIVTPLELLKSKETKMSVLPGSEGELGIMSRHTPLMTLLNRGIIKLFDENKVQEMKSNFVKHLDNEFDAAKSFKPDKADWLDGFWANMKSSRGSKRKILTSISKKDFMKIGSKISSYPEELKIHKTLKRIISNRKSAVEAGESIDWATAESLAFGSLLNEGYPVRLVGQDSIRGTFSQRHSAIVDQETEERYILSLIHI